MTFPEYVAFQDQYLALERKEDGDIFIPDIHDRVLDKVARGLATDWQDVAAVLASPPPGFSGDALGERARSLILKPTSTVFDAAEFREGYERLRGIAKEKKISIPPLED